MLRLLTFGSLRFADLTPVTARLERQRRRLTLLAVVGAAGPSGVDRERLLDLFWPESDPDRARNSLKQATFALRRDLDHDPFHVHPGRLVLNPEALSCDAYDASVAIAARDDAAILRLITAPWLDDAALSDTAPLSQWIDERRRTFSDEAIRVRAQVADAAFVVGDPVAAAEAYRDALRWDPYRAAFVSGAMKSLAASGDIAAALQVLGEYEERMARELQVAPDPAVVMLGRQLRARAGTAARDIVSREGLLETPPAWAPSPARTPKLATPVTTRADVLTPREWHARRVARRGIIAGLVVAFMGLLVAALLLFTRL
jgi:DNA-binding SARP family transcriptional activator